MEVKELESLQDFTVTYSKHLKKWYGYGEFILKGFQVKFKTDYFNDFDTAAKAAKDKAGEVVREFAK